jgi:hypothetical protein
MTSCGNNPNQSSDSNLEDKQEQVMQEANAQVGMPAIKNFQERKLAKQIFELRDKEDLVCYAYLFNQVSGKLIFIGKCMGYGLPYSVQYTNPQKYRYGIALPQADPNGLFMPEGLDATWIMLIDPDTGKPHPVYVEPNVIVSPFKLDI